MPRSKIQLKRSLGTLFSMTVDCVATNILLYIDFLQYLPVKAKERLLKKFLSKYRTCNNDVINKTLQGLVYPSLKHINFASIPVDNSTLSVFQICNTLTEIQMRNNGNLNVTSKGLQYLLKQTKHLITLDVSRCLAFDDCVLKCTAENCHKLRELVVKGCPITDEGFIFLTQHNKNFRCLTVSETKITGSGISNAIASGNCRHLEEFRVDNCADVTDTVVKTVFQSCPNLQIFTFYNCSIRDEALVFEEISKSCKKLKQLHWTITW